MDALGLLKAHPYAAGGTALVVFIGAYWLLSSDDTAETPATSYMTFQPATSTSTADVSQAAQLQYSAQLASLEYEKEMRADANAAALAMKNLEAMQASDAAKLGAEVQLAATRAQVEMTGIQATTALQAVVAGHAADIEARRIESSTIVRQSELSAEISKAQYAAMSESYAQQTAQMHQQLEYSLAGAQVEAQKDVELERLRTTAATTQSVEQSKAAVKVAQTKQTGGFLTRIFDAIF